MAAAAAVTIATAHDASRFQVCYEASMSCSTVGSLGKGESSTVGEGRVSRESREGRVREGRVIY